VDGLRSQTKSEMRYKIQESKYSGKACRGMKKTSTIRVIEPCSEGFLIKKQFQFKVGDIESKKRAEKRAKEWATEHLFQKARVFLAGKELL